MKNNRILLRLTAVLAAAMVALAGTPACAKTTKTSTAASIATQTGVTIPAYSGNPFAAVNNNVPYFTKADLTTTPFELYSDLDDLGRCGTAYANVCQDLMPTEPRGDIGPIKPTGWHSVKYAGIDGNYLYNRCHLIGYQLTGENANEKNLITGTRYLNVTGMVPFENMVADYVKETGNHVLYRVTPVFTGKNLLADGVLMEAESVEDKGEGILFCVFCYNVQPGITINYSDGSSSGPAFTGSSSSSATASTGSTTAKSAASSASTERAYIGNSSTRKFHRPDCSSVKSMKSKNKVTLSSREEAIAEGYTPCKRCNP